MNVDEAKRRLPEVLELERKIIAEKQLLMQLIAARTDGEKAAITDEIAALEVAAVEPEPLPEEPK